MPARSDPSHPFLPPSPSRACSTRRRMARLIAAPAPTSARPPRATNSGSSEWEAPPTPVTGTPLGTTTPGGLVGRGGIPVAGETAAGVGPEYDPVPAPTPDAGLEIAIAPPTPKMATTTKFLITRPHFAMRLPFRDAIPHARLHFRRLTTDSVASGTHRGQGFVWAPLQRLVGRTAFGPGARERARVGAEQSLARCVS